MLSEEEKRSIEMLNKYIYNHKVYNIKHSDGLENCIETVLNLITKLQKENKEKDNQIDLMAEYWFFKEGKDLQLYIGGEGKMMGYLEKKEKVIEIYKQRFEKLVKEKGE